MKIFAINEIIEGQNSEEIFMTFIDCDGVLDSDNDGWCDDIDPCPYTPGVNCPESDIDHDGIPDDEDDCPNDPGTSYYNGCPAPGEEDTDGDGVIDTYDHCPNQAGPASNNDCPLPEDCLCKDNLEVKKLLSDLGVQEDLIQQGEDLVEEKRNELSETLSKINEAIKEEKENWDWTNWSIDVGKATLSIIGILASEGTLGIVIGGSSGSLSLYQYREKHPLVKKMTLTNLNKLYALIDLISHHESILEWRVDRVIEVTNELRDKCACALN